MRRGAKNDEQVSIQEDSVPNQVGRREKKTSVRAKKGKDDSISSPESTRILRSRTQEKPKQHESPVVMNSAENGDSKKRKKRVQAENVAVDEFSKVRRNMSYVVNRIKYEQTLIDAYSAEGWKKQSVEKIRPERELQRAKTEIFRRKSVIRNLFLQIDQMCNEGVKIPKTSSDSTGEIDSDDLCCSKCGSKEFPANKEIIICDGCCDRGFHLTCLEPPILKKDLHLYADNWLCAACDCKFDCIDMVNDLHKADLSMTDSWEKVFPETVKNQDEDTGLPSDDDDFNPGSPVSDEKEGESNDSSKALPNEDPYLGLPSDDSEDDDFNPTVQDDDVKKDSSSSDFTSDSEDFSVAFNDDKEKKLSEDEQQVSSKLNDNDEEEDDTAVISAKRNVERLDYKKLHDEEYGSGTSDSSDEDYMDSSIKMKNNSVNKKRGKIVSSASPDNEDLAVNPSESKSTSKRRISKKVDVEETIKSPSNGKINSKSTPNRRASKKVDVEGQSISPPNGKSKSTSKSTKKRLGEAVRKEENGSVSSDSNDEDYMDNNIKNNTSGKKKRGKKVSSVSPDTNNEDLTVNPGESITTPKRSITQQLALEAMSKSPSNGKSTSNSKSTNRRLGEAATKRLSEYFNENQYPDVAAKESLAKEVGITAHQVNKWFMNTRWSYNHPSAKRSKMENNNYGT